jgi:hypothetical protein
MFAAPILCAPLSQASPSLVSGVAQLDTGANLFDKIDNLLNNFFSINSFFPQTPAPSVNITDVKTANARQSGAMPQVIVTVKNGKAALDGVRVDVGYKNAAGATVLSNTALLALKSDETRSITFAPKGLSNGRYAIGVVVYKNGTDPSSQVTPPYDARPNAATLIVASPTPSAAAEKAANPGGIANNGGNILNKISPWTYFIIAMTGLITVALFFVFSQNRSGEDRFQDGHFKADGHVLRESGGSQFLQPDNASAMASDYLEDAAPSPVTTRSRLTEISSSERTNWDSEASLTERIARSAEYTPQFDADKYIVGDVTSRKALRNKMRGKKGS